MNKAINVLIGSISTTDTSVPDDFLNLYPDEVSNNLGELANTGASLSPFLIGAMLLIAVGIIAMGIRRRRA
jgi:LPXTG-motif cell wall-anchored protein